MVPGAAGVGGLLGGVNDRIRDAPELFVAEAGRREQLLGALLRAGDDHCGLRASPLERLLTSARRVRELGRLMSRLLEELRRAGLGFADLLRRVALRLLEQLARFVPRRVEDLGTLAIRLGGIARPPARGPAGRAGDRSPLLPSARADSRRPAVRRARSCRRTPRPRGSGAARPSALHVPVGSTLAVRPAAWRTRSCACSCVVWRRNASKASRTRSASYPPPGPAGGPRAAAARSGRASPGRDRGLRVSTSVLLPS